MKKLELSKILEMAAGAVAILVALGNFLSAIIRPIKTLTSDYSDTSDKIFRILMGLERALLFVPVIVLGVALILRWVSQNKMKWVVLGASAFTGLVFIVYQLTDNISVIVNAKTATYATTIHPIRDAFIFILYTLATLAAIFLIYDAQSNVLKKNVRMFTFVAAYVSVGIIMFISMGRGLRSGFFIFPLLLIVAVLWRKELPTTTPAYFGFGGAAVSLLCSLFNGFNDPLNLLLKKTDIFAYLLSYNDALVIIGMALIPLLYICREFSDKKAD